MFILCLYPTFYFVILLQIVKKYNLYIILIYNTKLLDNG